MLALVLFLSALHYVPDADNFLMFLAVSLFVVLHTYDEVAGEEESFWAYYYRCFGLVRVSDRVGKLLFAGLALTLIGLAYFGTAGSDLFMGGLVGAIVADAALSHIYLSLRFPGPNPGLLTALLYLILTPCLLYLFPVSYLGLLLGAGAFGSFWTVSLVLSGGRVASQVRSIP